MSKVYYQPDPFDLLPKRSDKSHKGTCGRVGILAGSSDYAGAAALTVGGALRSGAGMVYAFTLPEVKSVILSHYPECIVYALPGEFGMLAELDGDALFRILEDCRLDVLAVGPGLGQDPSLRNLLMKLIFEVCPRLNLPMVLDADALNALKDADVTALPPDTILTPHEGEFARLFADKMASSDRVERAEDAARITGGVVVLKGNGTVISNGHRSSVNKTGNPGLASAGSGDVLTGCIASLRAQGLDAFHAAYAGVYFHGRAADLLVRSMGYGYIALDLAGELPYAMVRPDRPKE